MFFQPPKVKSLSRYAEYGAYLGNIHFLLMLAVAFTLHIGFIVIYSLTPSETVVRIPVHTINIKLSGGSIDNGVHIPPPSAMPGAQLSQAPAEHSMEDMKSVGESSPESAMDDALTEPEKKPASPAKKHPAPAVTGKTLRLPPARKAVHPSEGSLATPKRYVRESTKGASAAADSIGGDAKGTDIAERYTQVISQWIKNHQKAAREAYKEAAQGQEGVHGQTVIRLRIDRDGHIISNTIDHTSGNELVDEVATATVRASDPVPAVPNDYPSDSQLEFVIAVQVDFAKQQ